MVSFVRSLGRGFSALQNFSLYVNSPPPMTKKNYRKLFRTIHSAIVYFKTRGHLFLKISRFILGVEQPYFACPSESIFPSWGFNLGFCSSDVKKFFKKSLLKIFIFCELDF